MGLIFFFFFASIWLALATGLPAYIASLRQEGRNVIPPVWSVLLSAVILFTVNYIYGHYSPEAKARKILDEMVDLWQADQKQEAINKLQIAAWNTPWRPHDSNEERHD